MQGIHLKIDNLEDLKGNFDKLAFLKLKFAGLVTIIDKLEIPLSLKNKLTALLSIHISIKPDDWADQDLDILTEAIEEGVCPNNTHVIVHYDNYRYKDWGVISAIMSAIESGECPENFTITTCTKMVHRDLIVDLAELVKTGKLAKGFLFTLTESPETSSWVSYTMTQPFSAMVYDGTFPEDVTIDLCGAIYGRRPTTDPIDELSGGQCPNNLRLDYSRSEDENSESESEDEDEEDTHNNNDNTLSEYYLLLLKRVAAALASGKCPQNLSINFSGNYCGDAIAIAIAEVLQSGNCPANLELNLSRNNITDIGMKALAEALQSGKCAPGLSLDLTTNLFSFEQAGTQTLLAALESGKCPKNLQLIINGELEDFIKPLLGTTTIPGTRSLLSSLKSGRCPDGLGLTIYTSLDQYTKEKVGTDEALAIAEVLKSGYCPANFKIDLPNNAIDYKGIEAFTDALKNANCPNNLTIGHINIPSDDLVSILEDKNCPSSLQISNISSFFSYYQPDENLIQALLSNTKLTYIGYNSCFYSVDLDAIESLYTVQYCCLRNRLLQQFPDLAPVIKKIAYQAGMYLPKIEHEADEIPSLQNLAYSCILFKNVKNHSALPITLFNELTTLKTLQTVSNLTRPKLNS